MFPFNHHYQGAYYLSFAKVLVIKIISYNTPSWLVRWCAFIYQLMHHRFVLKEY
jgi:hypothetical protein